MPTELDLLRTDLAKGGSNWHRAGLRLFVVHGKFFAIFAWRNARRHHKPTAKIILGIKTAFLAYILDFFLRRRQQFGRLFNLDFENEVVHGHILLLFEEVAKVRFAYEKGVGDFL